MTPRSASERREHEVFRLLAAAAVDGRIAADDAAALEAHLAGCPACRADQQAMLDDHAWLASPVRVAPPDPRIRERILEAARSPRVPKTGPAPSARLRPALVAATLVLGVAGIGSLLASRPSAPAGGGPSAPAAAPTAAAPTLGVGGTCAPRPPGLLAWWPFDGSGGNLIAGGGATLVGDAGFETGIVGQALSLHGDGGFAEVADHGADVGTSDFTVSLWVRFDDTAGEEVLIEQFVQEPLAGWTLTKLDDSVIRLAIDTSDDRVDGLVVDSPVQPITAGTWLHVAARREGDRFSIVINGAEVASAKLATGVSANLSAPTSLKFGRRGDDRGLFLNGALDEVELVLGRAESNEELAATYRAGAAGTCADFRAERSGYAGSWSATDCAQRSNDQTFDCARWGDSSELRLTIGPGDTPAAIFEDASTEPCADGSGGSHPWRAAGTGSFQGVHLVLGFTSQSCGNAEESWANPMDLYRDVGTDTLWFDPDGDEWGIFWHRVH